MTTHNIPLSAENTEGVVLIAPRTMVVGPVYLGVAQVKTRRKNWSSS